MLEEPLLSSAACFIGGLQLRRLETPASNGVSWSAAGRQTLLARRETADVEFGNINAIFIVGAPLRWENAS